MGRLRDRILPLDDIKRQIIHVPQWGEVEVRGLTAAQRARIVSDPDNLHVNLVIACTYDPQTGERVFEDADRDALLAKSWGAISIVSDAAIRMSGLAPGAVEDAAKN